MTTKRKSLDELAILADCDKSSLKFDLAKTYEKYTWLFRDQPTSLLELGGSDESAFMWRNYFRHSEIVTINDTAPAAEQVAAEGVYQYTKDFYDREAIKDILVKHAPYGWRFIINSKKQPTIGQFDILWPKLAKGGFYIVQDVKRQNTTDFILLMTQYHDIEFVHVMFNNMVIIRKKDV